MALDIVIQQSYYFLNEKSAEIINRGHDFKGFASSYNVKILSFFLNLNYNFKILNLQLKIN